VLNSSGLTSISSGVVLFVMVAVVGTDVERTGRVGDVGVMIGVEVREVVYLEGVDLISEVVEGTVSDVPRRVVNGELLVVILGLLGRCVVPIDGIDVMMIAFVEAGVTRLVETPIVEKMEAVDFTV